MAQEIITWCDVCLLEDVRAAATTTVLTVNGRKPVGVDLCPVHEDQILKPLLELMIGSGRPADQRPRPLPKSTAPAAGDGASFACPFCDVPYDSPGGLARHFGAVHGASKPRLVDVLGTDCPVCGETFGVRMGKHIRAMHNQSTPEAFAAARDAGDPFGYWARARDALPVP